MRIITNSLINYKLVNIELHVSFFFMLPYNFTVFDKSFLYASPSELTSMYESSRSTPVLYSMNKFGFKPYNLSKSIVLFGSISYFFYFYILTPQLA
jgi:hypothetical protein